MERSFSRGQRLTRFESFGSPGQTLDEETADLSGWISPPQPTGTLDFERLEQQAAALFEDLGIPHAAAHQFFRHVPARLTQIRLQLFSLAKAAAAKQQVHLAGLAMQLRWLSTCASTAGFPAVGQVAAALETLCRSLYEQPARMTEATLRTLVHATELLSALASAPPSRVGRAEGAKVLMVDEDASSRVPTAAALEHFGLQGINLTGGGAALELLVDNIVDVIVLHASSTCNSSATPQLCQKIRRVPRQTLTPLLVLSPETQKDSRAVLAMSGATEVLPATVLHAELALKVMGHFFRGRLCAL